MIFSVFQNVELKDRFQKAAIWCQEEILDICEGKESMEDKQEEKYLGDVIYTYVRDLKNV